MLRALVLLLALANLALLALNLGWVSTAATVREREPERLAREVNAGQVRITPPGPVRTAPPPGVASGSVSAPASAADAASGAVAPASAGDSAAAGLMAPPAASAPAAPATASTAAPLSAPGSASAASSTNPATAAASAAADTSCLLAGPMSSERSQNLALALRGAGFAPGSWQTVALPAAPSWMLLMGPYPNQATLLRKQRELARRKVSWLELQPDAALPPNLAPGLDLGRYPSEAAADAAEARLNARGVQSARVVALPPVAGQVQLRLPAVDNAQQQRLGRLTLPPNARWQPCGA